MQGNPVEALPLAGSAPHDLSIITLFLQSDTIVKVVIFLLLAASFWSWAVIFDKIGRSGACAAMPSSFEESFWSGGSLDDLYDRIGARPRRSDVGGVRRRDARMAAQRGQGLRRIRHHARRACRSASSA